MEEEKKKGKELIRRNREGRGRTVAEKGMEQKGMERKAKGEKGKGGWEGEKRHEEMGE